METTEYATRMNENVIQPTKSKMQEGTLLTDLSSSTKTWASKVANTTVKSWKDITSALTEDTSQPEEDQHPTLYQDMPLMTDRAGKQTAEESSSLLDQSDTPLLHHGSPRSAEDDKWNWGNDDWDTRPPKVTPQAAEEDEGWEDWGNQNDLLIDFGDNKSGKGQAATTGTSKAKTTKTEKSSQQVTSLQDTWDDAGGWDDAAWEEIEQEVGKTPAILKSSKAD